MATDQILHLLISERDKLNAAILALQGTKRRGRPPKTAAGGSASPAPAPARKRRTFSKAQRAAAAARMKAYWAAKRKQGK
ncbi:MAG: hypothetical protein ACRD8O_01385 [Bryobacteraceae bacterium]